ncbi:MAG: N-acyl-D-amino-acid deacylase family protein [Flavitalea sp.]
MIKICTLALLLFLTANVHAQTKVDLLIQNGRIVDGTGNSWYYGDLAITNGKVVATGVLKDYSANRIIDAKNKIIAPGFIDVHTHIEGDEIKNPTADNFIYDGVTTVVTGNCGSSRTDIGDYLKMIDSLKTSVNVATLVGHNNVRRTVMGRENRAATEDELKQMELLVEKAMKEGAKGLSTGLIYIPGAYAPTDEIVRLATVASKYNGIYATHMRSEGEKVVGAINETLNIGKQANIPVQISHFKVGGQSKAGKATQTLEMVKEARKQGIEVTIDQYPYTASSTSLSSMLPAEVLSGTQEEVNVRLKDPAVIKQIREDMLKGLKRRGLKHFSYAVVANYRADTTMNGKSIEEINVLKGRKHKAKKEVETVIEMQLNGGAGMVFHGMWEDDVQYIMKYPFNMVASDASIRIFGEGVPHPRGYGSNGRVLAEYVRNKKIIPLEEAIRRMTSLPAQKFRLKDRGLLVPGYAADIVIFDPEEVQDQSTYTKPHAYTKGFSTVIVNGSVVVENGIHNGTRSGTTIR